MATPLPIEEARTVITRFIKGKLTGSGLGGYVVGVSGGIDSAVATALAAEAVGPEAVLGMVMPFRTSDPKSAADARTLIEQLRIEYRVVDISPMIDAYYSEINDRNRLRAGNKMARERMAVLFDVAHELNRLVLGTGNRTEICLGYTTWYGDSACSLNPVGELYKTEVRQMAGLIGIPREIIDKPPTADLWSGQTDEDEIGVRYELIDRLLRRLVEDGEWSMSRLEEEGFHATDVSRVVSLMNRNAFKRRPPDLAPLGKAAIPDDVILRE